jgi:hypothetical protein
MLGLRIPERERRAVVAYARARSLPVNAILRAALRQYLPNLMAEANQSANLELLAHGSAREAQINVGMVPMVRQIRTELQPEQTQGGKMRDKR